jgi:hypothetical protein
LDADGKFCGLEGYGSYPYLYIANINLTVTDILSSTVCVSSCPQADNTPIDCKSTGNVNCTCLKDGSC